MNPITVVADPIHHDFFSVVGSDIPEDCLFEFNTALGIVEVTPDFTRPHLALLERLPPSLPPGAASLRLTSATTAASSPVNVSILASGPQSVRLLQPGAAKAHPYTIVFVANPGIEAATGATFQADPVLTDRAGYQAIVTHGFHNLFGVTEDLLRQNGMDAQMRIVSIFDPAQQASTQTALAHEVPASNTMETRRAVLAPFLAWYGIVADMVFVIHGSTTHTRASAWHTTDDSARGGTAFTFNGVARTHGHFPRIPGSAAIPTSLDRTGLTMLHEFGHGASDFIGGKVIDLYDDDGDGTGFLVNKQFRTVVTDAIPGVFSSFEGANYAADMNRDGLGYPANWRSYHGEARDGTRPNLMDNYWHAFDDPQLCLFDRLTYDWFTSRLNAKLGR